MKPEKQLEIIIIKEGLLLSLARDVGSTALFLALIGIGIWTGSSAMQWTGALIGFIFIVAWGRRLVAQNRFGTIDGARRRLDDIERQIEGASS